MTDIQSNQVELLVDGCVDDGLFAVWQGSNFDNVPFDTQQDRRHETITNQKSVKNCYIDYIEVFQQNL